MDRVIEFIISFLSERGVDVSMDNYVNLNFMEGGIIDSFEILTLFMSIEEEFGIKIKPNEMVNKKIKTVAGLAKYIFGKIP